MRYLYKVYLTHRFNSSCNSRLLLPKVVTFSGETLVKYVEVLETSDFVFMR